MSFKISSVQEYFDTLDKRFNPEGAKGQKMTFQWELEGEGTWHANINDGTMELHEGAAEKPSVTLQMKPDLFVKMINGEINGRMAAMTRKLKISGNRMLAMKVQKIFPQV